MGGFVGSYPAGTPSRLRRRVRRAKRRYRDSRAPAVDSGRAVDPSGGGGSRYSPCPSLDIIVSSTWKSSTRHREHARTGTRGG